jgi:hypothetical protein
MTQPDRGDLVGRNDRHYRALVEYLVADRRLEAETRLEGIQEAAGFAMFHHPGRFADGAIERPALELGGDLESRRADAAAPASYRVPRLESGGRRHLLHMATTVLEVGGLPRCIRSWIREDPDSRHSLLLTRQGDFEVPPWLAEAVRRSGGRIIALPAGAPLLARARWAREVARSGADLVALHHSPQDAIPVVAFAAAGGPPVAVVNHADHIFWLGSTVSDSVINLRGISRALSGRRYTRHEVVLPIPLSDPPRRVDRGEARRRLGIPADQLVILSIGTSYKYRPSETRDFFATAAKILDRVPEAHLYLVGPERTALEGWLRCAVHERLHLVGRQPDASPFQEAAELYVEGFPFGSQTALLETALAGVPTVLAYAPACDLLATSDEALFEVVRPPACEDEYVERAVALAGRREERRSLGAELRRVMLEQHTGASWCEKARRVCRSLEAIAHRPCEIPDSASERSGVDVAVAAMHEFTGTSVGSEEKLVAKVGQAVFSVARQARKLGDAAGSYRLLRRYGSRWGYDGRTLLALARLVPSRALRLAPR